MTGNEKTVLEEIRDLLLEQNRLLAQMIEKPKECKGTECKPEKPKFGKVERSDAWKETCSIVFLDKPNARERWGKIYFALSGQLGYVIAKEAKKEGYSSPADYIEAHGLAEQALEIAKELFGDDVKKSEEIPKFSLLKT